MKTGQAGLSPQGISLRLRVVKHSATLLLSLGLLSLLSAAQPPADVTILRGTGSAFALTDSGQVENILLVKLANHTDRIQQVTIVATDPPLIQVMATRDRIELKPGEATIEPIRVLAMPMTFHRGRADVMLRIIGDGMQIDRPCQLLGPRIVQQTLVTDIKPDSHADDEPGVAGMKLGL